ncbi:MAG: tRNA (adenosine(37)-N6)-threonylcarbamoyltransferase complex ATPase subunit type 1 TsaE, partial [Victivallales bacterium]|nr:tRNA (adenosine(37)-N6)-threonylcarbamoyltransferase complex ATPase subunit type 1 TsaE [Victivallales bacterium]
MLLYSRNDEATLALGALLARHLRWGQVVALQGDLGAGKTVISRGVASGLGITEPVTSPTFTVAQEYKTPDGHWLYHLDMYRIDDEMSAIAFGIEEYLFSPSAITLVEWPERISKLLEGKKACIVIHITHEGDECRAIELPD